MSKATIRGLRTLARMESVEAQSVGDGDHLNGMVPGWSELVLSMETEDGVVLTVPLTRHDGELIIEVLHTVLHPNTNKFSPVQRLWEELDDVMDFLMVDDPDPEDKARAKALAEAIALISLPYSEQPDVAAIREEAVARWEQRE